MEKQYIIIFILFLELTGFCLFFLWHYEKEQLLYIKETIFNPSKSKSGLPSSPHMIQTVKEIIKKLPKNNYTLIDIGCGNGDFISKIHTKVSKVIGIELDAKHAELARKRFSNNMSISILTIDMVDYKFDSLTSPTIIYMYEPLWCLKKTDALPIYHKLLKNISEINLKECYIIYISGALVPILDKKIFNSYQLKILHHEQISRFLGWKLNHVYLLKIN
jgi:phospholipid N-methyltransferase